MWMKKISTPVATVEKPMNCIYVLLKDHGTADHNGIQNK